MLYLVEVATLNDIIWYDGAYESIKEAREVQKATQKSSMTLWANIIEVEEHEVEEYMNYNMTIEE